MTERFKACLLGLACGDAVGTAVEFKPRGSFKTVTDMTGGGAFRLKPGEWTDDTSMALCLAVSLIERRGFNPRDQMDRYCRWRNAGYLSSNGLCFDIGNTTNIALQRYQTTGDPYNGPTSPQSAGNGSLMRLAPVPMFFIGDMKKVFYYSGESSRTTHGAQEAVDACRLFGVMLALALQGETKNNILFSGHKTILRKDQLAPSIWEIACGSYQDKTESEISGSGYVVKSLEAALWCFLHTEGYSEAILRATNLGEDADTTAAICGQIAGAYYGIEGIPKNWLDKLARRSLIEAIAEKLHPAET